MEPLGGPDIVHVPGGHGSRTPQMRGARPTSGTTHLCGTAEDRSDMVTTSNPYEQFTIYPQDDYEELASNLSVSAPLRRFERDLDDRAEHKD